MTVAVRPEVIKVRLEWDDIAYAAHIGVRRRVESLRGRFMPRNGSPLYSPTLWSQDIDAAGAELAVAEWLDRPWCGEESQAAFDVWPDIQVRHTWHDEGSLIVRTRDRDGRYVLVTGHDGEFDLHGWMWLKDCKQERFKEVDGNTFWKVPAIQLSPMEELR